MNTKPRNLLFLFSDQHAQKVSGAYGDPVVQTPNIDRLAREGVRFDNAYCPSPICVPSRMSMLTGQWPHRQACWTNDDVLDPSLPTWPQALDHAGYDPVLIGRLHAVGPDQLRGYAQREVGDHSPNHPGSPRQSMGPLNGANDPNRVSLEQSGPGMCAYQAKDTDVTDAAVRWLQTKGAEKLANQQPICLTVGFMLPHPPYVADADAYRMYRDRVPPLTVGPDALEGAFHTWWRAARDIDDVTQAECQRARAAYWALVHRMDGMIGQILSTLAEIGALDDTLIVYASDHGDHLGERGLWWKHTFFDESAKVPLIMRLPGVLPAGETRDHVVNLVDLSQTMLEALGVDALPRADGKSFWPVACDTRAPWVNETFCEYCTDAKPDWTSGRAVQQRMVRSDQWKLCLYDSEPPLLFDLETDPQERRNRANDPECAEILRTLSARITEDWSQSAIAQQMRDRRIEKDKQAVWARETHPEETHIWRFSPEINRLDPDTSESGEA